MPDIPFQLLVPFKGRYIMTDRFNAPRDYSFAPRKLQKHEGIDLAPILLGGEPPEALAAQRGVVTKVGSSTQGYGNYVRIDHRWGAERYVTWYGHLERALIEEGAYVNAGQVIGIAGSSGFSTGIHLHLTLQHLRRGLANYVIDDVVDPEPFLTSALPPFYELSFIEDVTVRDGAPMQAGEPFQKVWRVRNTGNRAWQPGDTLAFARGERVSAEQSVPLPRADTGDVVDISVPMTAPTRAGRCTRCASTPSSRTSSTRARS